MAKEKELKTKVVSGFSWKFAERIAAQGVNFLVSIILARLVTPEEYGIVSIVMIFIAISNVLIYSGFGSSLIQKKDADDLDYCSVFYMNVVLSITFYIILFVLSPFIADYYEIDKISPVLRVLSISLIVGSVNGIQHSLVSRNLEFKKFFFSTSAGTITSAIIGISMAYKGYGVWAIVAQHLLNQIIDTIFLWFTVKWRPKLIFSFKRLKQLFNFGWKLLASSLLDTIYNEIRDLIIGKMYSAKQLAYYNRGKSFPGIIVNNITTAIQSVLFPAMSKVQDDKIKVKSMMRSSLKLSSFIIFPCMAGLAAVSNALVTILLTDKWLPCVPFLMITCFAFALRPIHIANLQAINAMGRSDIYLKLEIIKKVIGFSVLIISIKFGIMAIVISEIFTSMIALVINTWPNKKLMNYGYFEQMKDIIPNFLLSVFMAGCVYCVNFINLKVILGSTLGNILTLIIQVVLGIVIYIGIAALFKLESFNYCLNIVKPIILKVIKRGK